MKIVTYFLILHLVTFSSFASIFSKNKKDFLYYPGGSVKKSTSYYLKDNKKIIDGVTKEFYSSGGMQTLYTYKDGLLDGVAKEFYLFEVVKWQGKFKSGKKSGKWIFYDTKGNKKMKGIFKDGLIKEMIQYYTSGRKKRHEIYQGTQLIHLMTWDVSGNQHADKRIEVKDNIDKEESFT